MLPSLRNLFRFCTAVAAVSGCFGLARAAAQGAAPAVDAAAKAEQEKFFEEKVRPLLAARCQKCHGAEKQESGLRLDSRDAMLLGGEISGAAAVAGDPERSPLVKAIKHDGDITMPPKEKLADADIETLVTWVKLGLPWPNSPQAAAPVSMELRLKQVKERLWSLRPIASPPEPAVKQKEWIARGLDAYVLSKLEAAGLTPSPAADRRTLIRRATFDLHGLPPTPEEVEAFVKDESPDAYKKLIERLLASSRYGERWARHWLDLARYADTSGYAFQRERRYPYSYTYRDWVIGALNRDVPYDEFVKLQIAADKLPPSPDNRDLAALGFLTVGRKFNDRNADIDDQIDVVTRGLMGLTVACARCHDHKYDAIPTEDYYSLYGVFASSSPPNELPLVGKPAETEAYKKFIAELDKRKAVVNKYLDERHALMITTAREKAGEYLVAVTNARPGMGRGRRGGGAQALGQGDVKPRLVERWQTYLTENAKPDHAFLGLWGELSKLAVTEFSEKAAPIVDAWLARAEGTAAGQVNPQIKAALAAKRPTSKKELAELYGAVFTGALTKWKEAGANAEALGKLDEPTKQAAEVIVGEKSPTLVPRAEIDQYLARDERNKRQELQRKVDEFQVNDPGAPPRAMVVNDSGRPMDPRVFIRGDANRPGKQVPRQFVAILSDSERHPFENGSGRLDLANAIAAPENPLTARAIVNRVWMWHCGEPLVATPGDFGIRSERPVQNELLDYLAARLKTGGWSLKDLHREIMLSSTYQQASLDRADCRAADPENRLWWKMNRRRLEFESLRDSLLFASGNLDDTMGGRAVEIAKPPYSLRRTIYGYIDRQDLPNLFRVFDLASPDTSSDRRARTTVPQQALYLMNSRPALDEAKALAARAEVAAGTTPAEKITALYRVLFQRAPASDELTLGEQFINSATTDTTSGIAMSAWEQYAQLLLMTNEFAFVD